jgi:hypothetical protein
MQCGSEDQERQERHVQFWGLRVVGAQGQLECEVEYLRKATSNN